MMVNEFRGVTVINFNPTSGDGTTSSVSITGNSWLENWGIGVGNGVVPSCVGALFAYIVGFLLLAYAFLHFHVLYVK